VLPVRSLEIVARRAERLQPFSGPADRDDRANPIELGCDEVFERGGGAKSHLARLEEVVTKLAKDQHRCSPIACAQLRRTQLEASHHQVEDEDRQ
jgi:hypothetical protein